MILKEINIIEFLKEFIPEFDSGIYFMMDEEQRDSYLKNEVERIQKMMEQKAVEPKLPIAQQIFDCQGRCQADIEAFVEEYVYCMARCQKTKVEGIITGYTKCDRLPSEIILEVSEEACMNSGIWCWRFYDPNAVVIFSPSPGAHYITTSAIERL